MPYTTRRCTPIQCDPMNQNTIINSHFQHPKMESLLRHYCLFSDVTIMLWEFTFCRNLWVYWGATILIARGPAWAPGASHSIKSFTVVYSRLQQRPWWKWLYGIRRFPSAAMPRAVNKACCQIDDVFPKSKAQNGPKYQKLWTGQKWPKISNSYKLDNATGRQ